MDILKSKPYFLSVCLLSGMLALAVFGWVRATHDHRWGGWAMGDAQNLNASLHFAQEGFQKHFFLTYYHPGYLGECYGTESNLGYYTHYPPLSAIINGLIARYWGENLFHFRAVSVIFSVCWLFFFYLFAKPFVGEPVAALSTLFIGSSAAFMDYMDGVSPYPYSEFFVFGALLLFISSEKHTGWKKHLMLVLSWLLLFVESFNSFDYIFFSFIFIAGHTIFLSSNRSYVKIFLFGMAPVCGFALHLFQNAYALGGLSPAIQDLRGISGSRMAQFSLKEFIHDLRNLILNMVGYLKFNYGLKGYRILAVFFGVLLFHQVRKNNATKDRLYPFLMLFAIAILSWWLIGIKAAFHFSQQMVRQLFPVFAVLMSVFLLSTWDILKQKKKSLYARIVVACFTLWIISGPIKHTLQYLGDYPNLIAPNRCWTVKQPTPVLVELIEVSKKIKEITNFGDIIFIPNDFVWLDGNKQPSPLFEFYSQRRMEHIGNDESDFEARKNKVCNYIENELPRIAGAKVAVTLYAVLDKNTQAPHQKKLLSMFHDKIEALDDKWVFLKLSS
jgi:hypothetical protein